MELTFKLVKMDEIRLPSSMRSDLAPYKLLTFFRDKAGSRSRGEFFLQTAFTQVQP